MMLIDDPESNIICSVSVEKILCSTFTEQLNRSVTYTHYSKDLITFESECQRHHSHLPRHAINSSLRAREMPSMAFHGRGRRSLLPLLKHRVACRHHEQATP